jgi:hypothetical protein
MGDWTTAWQTEPAAEAARRGAGARAASWAFYAFTALLSVWVFLFASGLFSTLGWAEGSERHGADAVRIADDSRFGLPAMYLLEGQKAWWNYEVEVKGGDSGVRLIVGKAVPRPDFIVKVKHVRESGRGRFEIVAPASGVYTFSHELEPIGGLVGRAEPGATRYKLRWGVG